MSQSRPWQWVRRYRRPLGIVIVVASLLFLVWYVTTHPSVITALVHTNPIILLGLLVFYVLNVTAVFFINFFTVRICRKKLGIKEGALLTIYSTVINFFGPLQSGPGVRAVYLKTRIGLRIRDYTLATLFYYFSYAAINVSLLFITSWWILTVVGFVASIAGIVIGTKLLHFGDKAWDILAIYITALLQTVVITVIYYMELHAVGTAVSVGQALVYTASANLSLFVSLTPGGIGIRESFILFASSLHHIPLSAIISAGVLDRAFYVVFLVGLFIVGSVLHVKDTIVRKKAA